MPYQRPAVLTERVGVAGTPLGNTSFYIPTVVAKTRGQETQVSRTASAVSDGSYVAINGIGVEVGDTLTYEKTTYNNGTKKAGPVYFLPIRTFVSVSASPSDPYAKDFTEDVDFTVDKTNGTLDFTNAPALLTPEFDAFDQLAGGGSVAAGNYDVAIVATDRNSAVTDYATYTANGVNYLVVAAASSSVTVRWGKVPNAQGYTIYAKPTSATIDQWSLVSTITDGETTSVTLTAAIAAGAVTLSVANATANTPLASATVFIVYTYPVYNYDPKRYYDTNIVQDEHGVGSEAANAARLVMGPAGVGASNASMYLVAPEVSLGEVAGYQAAIAACESLQDLILMATTSSSDLVNTTLKAHCEDMSKVENSKERFGFVATTSAIMANTNVDLLVNKIKGMGGSRRVCFVVTDGGYPHVNSWQNTKDYYNIIDSEYKDAAYTLNQAVDGPWHAIAALGTVANLADPATPGTNKQVYGVSSGEEGTVRLWQIARKDTVAANGGFVLEDRFNNLFIRHALTCSLDSTEDSALSIGMAESYMAKKLRDDNDKFVGTKITNAILSAIKYTSKVTTDGLIRDEIIGSLASEISVYQVAAKPTWTYITFDYQPIYPCDVLKFEWGFDLSA
jgi:hypothetical protein